MSYPNTSPSNGTDAVSLLVGKAAAAGLNEPTGGLSTVDFLAAAVGNMFTDLPPGATAQNLASPISVGGLAGAAATFGKGTKTVTGLVDATFTDLLTVTIPNTKQNAVVRVRMLGSLGAGGTIGAGEAASAITYDFTFVRTPGVNAAALISTGFAAAAAAVAGATTAATLGQLSAVTGGVTASNTFTIQGKVTKGAGSSALHVIVLDYEILNAFATGITVA